jgi:dTDP-4-dehydrorhamnose 3,5-epimerase
MLRVTPLPGLPDVRMLRPTVHHDVRGWLFEPYNADDFAEHGIREAWCQDAHSRSVPGTIRGLHYQLNPPQSKLVRAVTGRVWDVVVDVRRSSPTFGRWASVVIDAATHDVLYVPAGYAHGFLVLGEAPAEVHYKLAGRRDPASERAIRWDDPDVQVVWPRERPPVLSARDHTAPRLIDADTLP